MSHAGDAPSNRPPADRPPADRPTADPPAADRPPADPPADRRRPPADGALEGATEHQPRARAALAAALAAGPSHAYLFRGPRGAGKRAAARAFAAEVIAAAAPDPADARRRALLDPSPHPDLVWLAPRGAQHMVEDVRERVIRAAAYRPFEAGRRVFVIEEAEAMRDESQNALLKTLEEPPPFVHLVLISSEPEALLATIASRCQPIDFAPLPTGAVVARLSAALNADGPKASTYRTESARRPAAEEVEAAARLAEGDLDRARLLLSESGRELRAEAERCAAAALAGELADAPWSRLLAGAERAGEEVAGSVRAALEAEVEAGVKRTVREISEEEKRAGRRRRTEILDLALGLVTIWFRDLAAVGSGAEEVVLNGDRCAHLREQAAGLDPRRARAAAEAVQGCRRRLALNVSEELSLEALFFSLQRIVGPRSSVRP